MGKDKVFFSLLPGAYWPRHEVLPAPPGLVLWVNTRCGAAIELPRNLLQARRADTTTAGGDSHRWERMSSSTPYSPRGLSAPAQGTAAPPGLVLWVNTRCGAAIELHRNLVQARRAGTATAGGDSHRIRCVNLLFFVLSPSQVIGSGVFAIARIRSVR